MLKYIYTLGLILMAGSCLAAGGHTERSVVMRTGGTPTDSLYYKGNAEKLRGELKYYRGMKATGGGLTGLGALFFASGQSLLWTSVALNETGRRHYQPIAKDPLFIAGLGSTVLTIIPMAFGVPLLRYGTKQVRLLKKNVR